MDYSINKGCHYGFPMIGPSIRFNKILHKLYTCMRFDASARYDVGDDQSDVNKLFGVSYGYHHNQSDRIGWRYNKDTDKVELVLYSYVRGSRVPTKKITEVNIGELFSIDIIVEILSDSRRIKYLFKDSHNLLRGEYYYSHDNKCISYLLGPYFGGNKRAPHKITYNAFHDYDCY